MKQTLHYIALLTFVALLLYMPTSIRAACGDADGNGQQSISDVAYLIDYLYGDGPPPADFSETDFDLAQNLTVSDVGILTDCITWWCDSELTENQCPPVNPPLIPTIDSNYVLSYPGYFPPDFSQFSFVVRLYSPGEAMHHQFSVRVLLDSQLAQIDSVQYPVAGSFFDGLYGASAVDHDSATIACGSMVFPLQFPDPTEDLIRIFLSATPAPNYRPIELVPDQHIPTNAPPGFEIPLQNMIFVSDDQLVVAPVFHADCCVIPGDVDRNGRLSIGDGVYLINCLFGGCDVVCADCYDRCDPDGNGQASIGDVVYIINYIFASGPEPTCGPEE